MSIRRLDPDTNMSGLPLMVPADDGGYVDYDDHEAEVERLQARERELEAALDRRTRERDIAYTALSAAARRFTEGDHEGVRLLLCDMNAREHAAALAAVSAEKDTPRSRGFADNIINWKAKEGDSE